MRLKKIVQAGAVAALTIAGTLAQATPIQYSFTTSSDATSLDNPLAALWAGQASVSGTLTYNTAAPYFGNTGDMGYGGHGSIYVYGITDLSGSIAGQSFSDAWGTVSISNAGNVPSLDPYGDTITLSSDAIPKVGENKVPADVSRQLVGFETQGYRLQNVRLFWASALASGQQLVNDQSLPSELPTNIEGRLALDFVKISDPDNTSNAPYYNQTVFFNGLRLTQISSVPEVGAGWMALLGVAAVAIRQRARSRQD